MSLPRRRRAAPIVLAGILAAAIVTWIAKEPWEPAVPAAPGHEPELATAGREQQGLDRTPDPRADAVTTDPQPTRAGPVLHVRLRGLHAKAPWTAPLRLDVDGRHEAAGQWLDHDAQATPDADGRCSLPLPSWYLAATRRKGRIDAADPNYRVLQLRWEGAVDPAQEMVIDVQVVAIFEGRVVDGRGNQVPAARVCAFAIRDGTPVDPKLAESNTNHDGRYRLCVPPDVPLLLVAAPMQKDTGSRFDNGDGSVRDTGRMRSDLLPATRRASCAVAVPGTEDFVLPDATPIPGVVRWSNGKPVEQATVGVSGAERVLQVGPACAMHVLPSGAVVPLAQTHTDEQGQFRLPGVQGAAVDIRVVRLQDAILFGDLPVQTAVPPQPVELAVPVPITVRVVHAGVAVPLAELELESEDARTGANGELAVVSTRPLRVRANHEHLQSPWVALLPAQAGTTVVLELAAALGEVSIEFEGEFRVRNASIAWRSEDGREGREHFVRDDRSGPFRLFLPPGRYHLSAGPGGGERNGLFLLPVERDVEVGAVPRQITLPGMFGGRFTVHATDSSGLYVGGTCRVVDSSGKDVTDRFAVRTEGGTDMGAAGELLLGGPNDFTAILPAGDYLLTFDFRDHGAREHRVAIRPRDVAEVRVRL